MKEDDGKKYSLRAEKIGKNIIKKSKSADKFMISGMHYLENFTKALLSVRPKNVEPKKREKEGGS